MLSYVSPEQRVPADHPLRPIREMTDEVLRHLSPRFARLYAKTGRPSIAPEKLLRALLLQVLYSVRSERLLMEQLHYNLLFRWFVGLSMDDRVWDVIRPAPGRVFDDPSMVLRAAVAGQGLALGRSVLLEEELADGRLVQPLGLRLPSRVGYYLVYPEELANVPKVRAFRCWLLDEAHRNP